MEANTRGLKLYLAIVLYTLALIGLLIAVSQTLGLLIYLSGLLPGRSAGELLFLLPVDLLLLLVSMRTWAYIRRRLPSGGGSSTGGYGSSYTGSGAASLGTGKGGC